MRRTALIDNDALVHLSKVDGVFSLMRNLFQRLEIPTEVKNEFEAFAKFDTSRSQILTKLKPNIGFWSLCTTLDPFSQVLLFDFKGIDKGEAELISQSEKKGIRTIISDDKKFKKTADGLNKNFLIVNSLFVIASLDINGFILETNLMLKNLHEHYPFKSKDLREAYEIALKEYGIYWTKKKISAKSSLKKLGIS